VEKVRSCSETRRGGGTCNLPDGVGTISYACHGGDDPLVEELCQEMLVFLSCPDFNGGGGAGGGGAVGGGAGGGGAGGGGAG